MSCPHLEHSRQRHSRSGDQARPAQLTEAQIEKIVEQPSKPTAATRRAEKAAWAAFMAWAMLSGP